MDTYERHELRVDQLERRPDPYHYDVALLRATMASEPAPGVPDYSVLSRGVARVKEVDEIRANAEAWETSHPLPGLIKRD